MKPMTATAADVAVIATQLRPEMPRLSGETDGVYRARLIHEARLLLEEAERQDAEPMKASA